MADMRREWSHDNWDGDPRTLPLSVVRKLRRDPHFARLVFGTQREAVTEAFEAGLSIGYLAAQQAAELRDA
jgi:hypothetical protein